MGFRRNHLESDGQTCGHNIFSSELSRHSLEDVVLHLGHILKYQVTSECHGAVEDVMDTALHAIRSTTTTRVSELTELITKQAFEEVPCEWVDA